MCGIAGLIANTFNATDREERVRAMCASMLHRGPDDSGLQSLGTATLGMRRLAIFDPANGHQPMSTPDGRFTIVFNGAIYNHRALREALEASGCTFRTHCDTEVLLAALATWGESALGRLRGMFAFGLWDAAEQSLLAARDAFGIKPLYFSHKRNRFAFASEVSALIAGEAAPPEIDPLSVAEYLAWLAVPAPRTIYKDIACLRPGEFLKFRGESLEIQPWWTFQTIPAGLEQESSRPEFLAALRVHLEDTIRAHLLADVPVGAFLSGGLDSAVVAGLMSRVSGNALRTFSIAFEEDDYSEADQAEVTAHHFGAVHHTRVLSGDEVAHDIDVLMASYDQPTGDGVNTYYASQTAQQAGMKVALSGLGGDEVFGGYPSFRTVPALASTLPAWRTLPSSARSAVVQALQLGGTRGRKLSDVLGNARDAHEVAALHRRVFSDRSRQALLFREGAAPVAGSSLFHPALEGLRSELSGVDRYSLVSAWELRTYMADVLLRDSDVMSMRHSLELRVPFIDRPLIEWLWRQPARFKEDSKHPKSALAEATRDLLPPGLLGRRKRGFTLPFAVWMRKDLRPFLEDVFSGGSIARSGLFDPVGVQNLWRNFYAGGENRNWSRVWSLAVLIAFVNRRTPVR